MQVSLEKWKSETEGMLYFRLDLHVIATTYGI